MVERSEQPQRLLDGELVGELRLLELDAEALAQLALVAPSAGRAPRLARVGREQPFEDLDRRRLAGAVRAEQAEALAAAHLERQAVDGHDVAVAFLQILAAHCKFHVVHSPRKAAIRVRLLTVPDTVMSPLLNSCQRSRSKATLATAGLLRCGRAESARRDHSRTSQGHRARKAVRGDVARGRAHQAHQGRPQTSQMRNPCRLARGGQRHFRSPTPRRRAERRRGQAGSRGTRRAQRVKIVDGVEVLIDGSPATLIDLSVVGAQVVSPDDSPAESARAHDFAG